MRPGRIWASSAASGSCGRASVQFVVVDWRHIPFGSPTMVGNLVVLSVLCGLWGRM